MQTAPKKLCSLILEKDCDFFFTIGNIEIRMYPKKHLKKVTEFLETEYVQKNIKKQRHLFGKRLIDTYINKNRIKLPYQLLNDKTDLIFIVKEEEHIKLFLNEYMYNEYLNSIKKNTK